MDLRINAEKIRCQRKGRAWSQEHLAEVAGLGRRTIQRIEQGGAASFESAQAIAAEPLGAVVPASVLLDPVTVVTNLLAHDHAVTTSRRRTSHRAAVVVVEVTVVTLLVTALTCL